MPKEYQVEFTRQAIKDLKQLTPKLKEKVRRLCHEVLIKDPHEGKTLIGDLKGSYSLRLSYQDHLVYSIDQKKQIVFVERCRTHYGD